MTELKTRYDFTLPRGYVDGAGTMHRTGTMRLATARDELDPLRDPSVSGPDDPRLTILVLARVVERLGALELVTSHEIENLFAVDLAFLQDFYGVINFGNQEEYDALLRSQAEANLLGSPQARPSSDDRTVSEDPVQLRPDADPGDSTASRPNLRAAVEEIRRQSV